MVHCYTKRLDFNLSVNLLVNFCEYVLRIALTRSIFQPKMHQIVFGGRAPPGELQRSPSRNSGPTTKGREGKGEEGKGGM